MMNYKDMPEDRAERVFVYAVADLVELIESKQVDLVYILRSMSRCLRNKDQVNYEDIETALSVLTARRGEDAYYTNAK
jgi:hypothetical protein